MADDATDLLSKAIGAKIAARGQAPVKAEAEPEKKHSHSYKMSCPSCQATVQFSDEDLDGWRTSDETSETENDDDVEEGEEDDDDDELDEDRKSALAASIIKAAKNKND
jgi:hypothetical protein